jgi:hypothetical protein
MSASILVGLFAIFVWIFFAILGLAGFAFWLWMLIHAITNKGLADMERVVWVLVVIFLPFIGSIIYFFLGRPKGRGAI